MSEKKEKRERAMVEKRGLGESLEKGKGKAKARGGGRRLDEVDCPKRSHVELAVRYV